MTTIRHARQAALAHGCVLDASYSRAHGWDLYLQAPENKLFTHNGSSVDADIAGVGMDRNAIDWSKTIDSINAACASGFEDEQQFDPAEVLKLG